VVKFDAAERLGMKDGVKIEAFYGLFVFQSKWYAQNLPVRSAEGRRGPRVLDRGVSNTRKKAATSSLDAQHSFILL